MASAKFIISGRVQGVGFRVFVAREACQLGLVGEVWNRRDGAVVAIVCGDLQLISALEELLHRGPGSVESVHREDIPEASYSDFNISYRD